MGHFPTRTELTLAFGLNANMPSSFSPSLMNLGIPTSIFIAAPGTIERFSLIPETDKVENLTGGNNYGINQIHEPFIPQYFNAFLAESSEAIFIDAIQPLDVQGLSIFKNDIEHDRTKKIQRQGRIDETVGVFLTVDQLPTDEQYFL